ncbi:hypothetical protein MM213_05495 [Belliella sp. R4-6]|uniref:Uncharacterized protein n=1 Tax=Belliella alkalica TaxID=1730871 RepID=A0ABS9V945_9BACT|nr:hypothetical protein [Belliella alkalica]MCH7412926.1 hypothetical protein [Belliella alkalica]
MYGSWVRIPAGSQKPPNLGGFFVYDVFDFLFISTGFFKVTQVEGLEHPDRIGKVSGSSPDRITDGGQVLK